MKFELISNPDAEEMIKMGFMGPASIMPPRNNKESILKDFIRHISNDMIKKAQFGYDYLTKTERNGYKSGIPVELGGREEWMQIFSDDFARGEILSNGKMMHPFILKINCDLLLSSIKDDAFMQEVKEKLTIASDELWKVIHPKKLEITQ